MRWGFLLLLTAGCQLVGTSPTDEFASASGSGLGGCDAVTYFADEFGALDCACGLNATSDSDQILTAYAINSSGTACETPCNGASDCPDPRTSCQSGTCKLNTCSTYFSACDASQGGANDGECIPYNGIGGTFGLCGVGGSVPLGGACSAFATRGDSTLCALGLVCTTGTDESCALETGSGICQNACAIDGTCSTGLCLSTDPNSCFTPPAPFYCPDGGS